MTQFDLSPSWGPLALEAVFRLRDEMSDKRPAPTSSASRRAPGSSNGGDDGYDLEFDGGHLHLSGPEAQPQEPGAKALPGSIITPHLLLLTLRLAATFGTAERIEALTRPGAVTLLQGASREDMSEIADRIAALFLPPSATPPRDKLQRDIDALARLSILLPSRTKTQPPEREIREGLETHRATLILLPDDIRLPRALLTLLPVPLTLAPVDREITLAQLAMTYSEGIDLEALRRALPENAALASVPQAARALALRAPSALEAANQLAKAARPRVITAGPDLDQIAGDTEALRIAKRMVRDLADWKARKIDWSEATRSALFFGPPGSGKTWLARAMGASAGVTFISAGFGEWQAAGHLGDMLGAMRRSFAEARAAAPAILFIDETDAAGSRFGGDQHGKTYQRQVINAFLQEIDALMLSEGVLLVGATNDPGAIDPAILRPGRFDTHVEVPLPDATALEGMLRAQCDWPEETLRALARAAVGQSAAELDAAIRAARSEARDEGRPLAVKDLARQLETLQVTDPSHDWRVALHECGHAIAYAALGLSATSRLVLTRNGGGEAHGAPTRALSSLSDLEDAMTCLLAGRAAESLVLGEASAGAGGTQDSDLARATRHAVWIETRYGLGHHQLVWLDAPDHVALHNPHVYGRVRARIAKAETRARALLHARRATLEAMAQALLERRELKGEELARWLAPLCSPQPSSPSPEAPRDGLCPREDM